MSKPSNKKFTRRPKRKFDPKVEYDDDRKSSNCMHSGNDATWYAKNPQLLKDAASLSFAEVLGNDYILNFNIGTNLAYTDQLPGVMVFPVCPVPGNTQETNSPVNVAARCIYGYVRHANSGSANYDIPDIMIYLLCMDSLYSMWSYLRRAYGIISYYDLKNRYTGKALITAMGLDYDSLLANLSDFRQYINTFALKIGALVVPKNMSYFLRHMWMYENVYRDAEHPKSQFYMYTPEYFYKYTETGSNPGSAVPCFFHGYHGNTKSQTDHGLKDFVDIVERCNEMIDAMMSSEDCGIMSGDILKAFGADNVWKLSATETDWQVVPVWNQEVLTQFHNIETLTNGTHIVVGSVALDDGTAYALSDSTASDVRKKIPATFGTVSQYIQGGNLAPILQLDNLYMEVGIPLLGGYKSGHILDLPYSDVTPDNVMVATRGKHISAATGTVNTDGFNEMMLYNAGSDVIARIEIVDYDYILGVKQLTIRFCGTQEYLSVKRAADTTGTSANIALVAKLNETISRFDYHPHIFWESEDLNASPVNGSMRGILGEMDNYTIIDPTVLERMNEVALLSQFDTPQAAIWSLKA